ncbi:glycosyltransferase family A protein [Rhodospirillaceae bacterium SYSU D60014]|uniref:glycosyltransferase family A protein n=1 Tax=Virgifigura deserti TaxID=2268457 RepID=UPI0013C446D6
MSLPRVTFGIIVLNGEPFTRYTLRALYPFAHEIIVAEGAAPGAQNVASSDGHSRDGTLDILRRFKAEEDPENKVTIVTAEDEGHPNGFWPGEKDEQSQAYAKRATGDYLWQVDMDEFYRAEEMARVLAMLRDDPTITAVTFKQITFWGGLDYRVDGWYLRRGATYYHRLFKWGHGYSYATHRPPTVLDDQGRNLRDLHWIKGETLAARGIHLYHYSLLLPKQVIEKCDYYANAEWAMRAGAVQWAQDAFLSLRRPFRVHNVYNFLSWLERYSGPHPDQVQAMIHDVRTGGVSGVSLRETADIERLLASPWYALGRWIVQRLDPVDLWLRRIRRRLINAGAVRLPAAILRAAPKPFD